MELGVTYPAPIVNPEEARAQVRCSMLALEGALIARAALGALVAGVLVSAPCAQHA